MTEVTSVTIAPAGQGEYFLTTIKRVSAEEAGAVIDFLQSDTEAFFTEGASDVPEGTKAAAPRRGKGKAAKEAEAETEKAAPKKGSRRPAKAKEPEAEAEAEAEAPADPKPTRRRRAAPAKAPEDEGITDADLVKACNDAAETITPEVVALVLMEDFQLEDVAGLAQEDRQKFIDTLDFEVGQSK